MIALLLVVIAVLGACAGWLAHYAWRQTAYYLGLRRGSWHDRREP